MDAAPIAGIADIPKARASGGGGPKPDVVAIEDRSPNYLGSAADEEEHMLQAERKRLNDDAAALESTKSLAPAAPGAVTAATAVRAAGSNSEGEPRPEVFAAADRFPDAEGGVVLGTGVSPRNAEPPRATGALPADPASVGASLVRPRVESLGGRPGSPQPSLEEGGSDADITPLAIGYIPEEEGGNFDTIVATPIDLDAEIQEIEFRVKKQLQRRQRRRAISICLLVAAVLIIIVVGVIYGTAPVAEERSFSAGSTTPATPRPPIAPTALPSTVPTAPPTMSLSAPPSNVPSTPPSVPPSDVPSALPSVPPSAVPSARPTTVRETFVRDCASKLSGRDGAALVSDPSSPQGRAVEWFVSGPGRDLETRELGAFTIYAGYEEERCMREYDFFDERFVHNFDNMYALLVLRESLNIQFPTWYPDYVSSSADFCSWTKVVCDWFPDSPYWYVVALNLGDLSLEGSLPKEVSALKHLRTLDVGLNPGIVGELPIEIMNISSLVHLDLSGTGIGSLPNELSRMPNLREFHGRKAFGLRGEIPRDWGDNAQLKVLDLFSTNVSGKIPSELGNLIYLEELDLSHTNIVGTLPTALGKLENIRDFSVRYTNVEGTIPLEFGNLTKMRYFDAGSTNLNGSVPDGVCSLRTTASPPGLLEQLVLDCLHGDFRCNC